MRVLVPNIGLVVDKHACACYFYALKMRMCIDYCNCICAFDCEVCCLFCAWECSVDKFHLFYGATAIAFIQDSSSVAVEVVPAYYYLAAYVSWIVNVTIIAYLLGYYLFSSNCYSSACASI